MFCWQTVTTRKSVKLSVASSTSASRLNAPPWQPFQELAKCSHTWMNGVQSSGPATHNDPQVPPTSHCCQLKTECSVYHTNRKKHKARVQEMAQSIRRETLNYRELPTGDAIVPWWLGVTTSDCSLLTLQCLQIVKDTRSVDRSAVQSVSTARAAHNYGQTMQLLRGPMQTGL